jgi:murein DD-endopeptidase MepM/ murein hydrolase activator NlpD
MALTERNAMRPVTNNFTITCPFGKKGSWAAGYHTGVDFGCPVGTPVYAPHNGKVTTSTYDGGAYGHYVVVEGWTIKGKRRWLMAHMSSRNVSVGQKVKRGKIVGKSGDTGNTTGPHVHAEQRHSPFGYNDHEYPTVLMRPWKKPR